MPRVERPLAAGDGPVVRFAADLRKLREGAGNPVYRELSRRAHYSPAALSEAAAGRRLPSLSVTLAYVSACSGDTGEWERRWREVTAALREAAGQPEPAGAPYLGLAPYEAAHAHLFFGREKAVADLVDRVNGRGFAGLFGPSGSGKSSILRAGLAASRGDRPTIVFTPGANPVEECAVRLASFLEESPAVLRAEFAADPDNLGLRVRQALVDHGEDMDLLLVVDQFEEVFTLCADPSEREAFISALLAASTGRARVAIGVRADFQDHCARHPGLVAALRDGRMDVGTMTTEDLRRAVTQPAVSAGCIVSTALVARMVSDVAGEVAALPLLSQALLETWRRRQGATLTVAGYEAGGGIHHCLARIAEQTVAELTEDRQRIARRLFLRLIALGDCAEDGKRRVSGRELDADDATKSVLDCLVDARLLTVDADGVEIVHESLIRHWPRLRDWLAEDRDGRRIQRALTRATDDWEALDRDPGALYRGLRLTAAAEWAARSGDAVTARERVFLDTSQSARRRHTIRRRQVAALLGVLLLVAVSATGYAIYAQRDAAQQRNIVLSQQLLGLTSLRATDPSLALQLTVAAYRLDPSAAARDRVLSSLATPHPATVSVGSGAALGVALGGRLMVASGEDGAVALFDVADLHHPVQLATLSGLHGPVSAVAINPAGTLVATGGADGIVRLWDVSDLRRPRRQAELAGHAAKVASVAFAPDGRMLATGSDDGTARLWDVQRGSQLAVVRGGPSVALDGHRLATADTAVHVFDLANPHNPSPGPTFPGHAVAFGPTGIVATADGTTIRLWDAKGGPLAVLSGHTKTVATLAFSPDGRTLASGGADRTARLWDVDGRPLAVLSGHASEVSSVAFGPDGHSLATASADKIVRIEDLTPALTAAPVTAIAVSGTRAVTGGRDGATRLLDVSDPHQPRVITEFPGGHAAITAITFDRDRISTVDSLGRLRSWDVDHPDRPITERAGPADRAALSDDGSVMAGPDPDGGVRLWHGDESTALPADGTTAVALSRDGQLLACGGTDHKIRIWDLSAVANPTLLATLSGHTDIVNALAFAPDGHTLASGGVDDTVRIWDLHRQIAVLTGHTDAVQTLSFSADGATLASAGADGTVRFWTAYGAYLAVLTGHTDTVNAVAFDGPTVLSGGDDTLRLWDTDVNRAINHICAVAWPRLTEADWHRYLPAQDYHPPCP